MVYKSPHLSDDALLEAADGELPERRMAEVRTHLRSCWTCRSRMAELEGNIAEFVACYHALLDPLLPREDGAGYRLTARLAHQTPAQSKGRFIFRLEAILQWKWAVYAAAGLLVLVAVGVFLTRHGAEGIAAKRYVPRLEAGTVPNPSLTPGATTVVSRRDVCESRSQPGNRPIPDALKQAVFAEYGLKNASPDDYEVDFLITPELGGSATISNLWPEPYIGHTWTAHDKDALEDRLSGLVCSGALDLSTAQRELATNWVDAYKKYVLRDKPM